MKGVINVYGCGGAGINVIEALAKGKFKPDPQFAKINAMVVDSSDNSEQLLADLQSLYPIKTHYIYGSQGGGRIRAAIYGDAVRALPAILKAQPPEDLNIVVCAASGASGSVIGPVIASELLRIGANVVLFVIGIDAGQREAENTVNTLRSLSGISKLRGEPLTACFIHKGDQTRSQVANRIVRGIIALANLFSDQHLENDLANLTNFFHYHKVTDYTPDLCALSIRCDSYDGEGHARGNTTYIIGEEMPTQSNIALVTLKEKRLGDVPSIGAKYESFAIDMNSQNGIIKSFIINHGTYEQVVKVYIETIQKMKQMIEEENARNGGISDGAPSTDDGLVL